MRMQRAHITTARLKQAAYRLFEDQVVRREPCEQLRRPGASS